MIDILRNLINNVKPGVNKIHPVINTPGLVAWIDKNCHPDLLLPNCPPDKLLQRKIWSCLHPTEPVKCKNNNWLYFTYFSKKLQCTRICGCFQDSRLKKVRNTNKIRYGNASIFAVEEIKEKSKQTNLKILGVEYPMQSKLVQEKSKQTNLKILGVEYPMQSKLVQEKIQLTNLKKRGVKWTCQDPLIREKAKQTNLKNLGVDCPLKSAIVRNKIKETNLKKFGVENPMKNLIVKEKANNTILFKFGVKNPSQSAAVKEKKKETNLKHSWCENPSYRHLNKQTVNILSDYNIFKDLIYTEGTNAAVILGIHTTTLYRYAREYNLDIFSKNLGSSYELEIANWLKSLNINFIQRDHAILKPYELDFYFPKKNFAIEFNGDYYHMNPLKYNHSDRNKSGELAEDIWSHDKWKYDTCLNKNINLLQIWESDWNKNKNGIKYKIKQKLDFLTI